MCSQVQRMKVMNHPGRRKVDRKGCTRVWATSAQYARRWAWWRATRPPCPLGLRAIYFLPLYKMKLLVSFVAPIRIANFYLREVVAQKGEDINMNAQARTSGMAPSIHAHKLEIPFSHRYQGPITNENICSKC